MYLRKRDTVGTGYKNVNNLFLSDQNLLVRKPNNINKNSSYASGILHCIFKRTENRIQ